MSIAYNLTLTHTHVHRYTDHSLAELAAEMLLSSHKMGRWGIVEKSSTYAKNSQLWSSRTKNWIWKFSVPE